MATLILFVGIVIFLSFLVYTIGCSTAQGVAPLPPKLRLRVATTTSLYDTGLWGYLEPMFEKKYNRDSAIIAIGGGVVGDIAGFVACIFCRGIPYLQIPT